jgi:hypothetical protein
MRIKKMFQNRYGCLIVVITNNSGVGSTSHNMTKFMHLFMKPRPSKLHNVFHIDGDKTNNHVDNLVWMTNQERVLYGFKKKRRTSSGFTKPLSIKEKRIITQMWNAGKSQVKIGKKIGRNNSTISKYLSGYKCPRPK